MSASLLFSYVFSSTPLTLLLALLFQALADLKPSLSFGFSAILQIFPEDTRINCQEAQGMNSFVHRLQDTRPFLLNVSCLGLYAWASVKGILGAKGSWKEAKWWNHARSLKHNIVSRFLIMGGKMEIHFRTGLPYRLKSSCLFIYEIHTFSYLRKYTNISFFLVDTKKLFYHIFS